MVTPRIPKPLAPVQRRAYDWMLQYELEHGHAPSLDELRAAMGWRSTNACTDHIAALERKGWLERDRKRVRGRRLLRPLLDPSPRGMLARACQLAEEWQPPGKASLVEGGWEGTGTGWWLLELDAGSTDGNDALLNLLEPAFIEACWQSSARGGRHVYSWGTVPSEARPPLRLVEASANTTSIAVGGDA